MASRRRKSDDGNPAAAALLAVAVGAVWLWDRSGPWRWPVAAITVVLILLVIRVHVSRGRQRNARQRLLDTQYEITRTMTGTQFEELVVRLLHDAGWHRVRRVGGSGDLGADVLAEHDGQQLVVQCKRWDRKKIGSRDMQTFLGTVFHVHHAELALYVTTSTYTDAAASLAASAQVQLLDGPAVASWQAYGPPALLDRRATAASPRVTGRRLR